MDLKRLEQKLEKKRLAEVADNDKNKKIFEKYAREYAYISSNIDDKISRIKQNFNKYEKPSIFDNSIDWKEELDGIHALYNKLTNIF